MTTDSTLSPGQQKAITALLATNTQAEAAQAAGVSLRTIARWLRLPSFRDALQRDGIDLPPKQHRRRRIPNDELDAAYHGIFDEK